MKNIRYLFIILCCLSSLTTHAQIDTLFWFAAPEVSQDGVANDFDRPIVLRMTAFTQAATVTISQPACTGCMPVQTLNIPAGTTTSLDLTLWIDSIENKPPNTVLNYGLKISSTTPISAYYHEVSTTCTCNPEFFVLKGQNAMGTDFWIPSQNFLDNDPGYTPTPYSAFDIVATQNNTTVTITPSNNIVGHTAGTPFTITLNTGQTYSATAASQAAALHLQGSRVTSNKPITINVKDDLLNGGIYGTCADLAGDQIVPTNIIGTEYIAMNGSLNAPGDQLFITATQNATSISQNGAFVTTINAGQTYQLAVGGPSTYIQTSKPAYVYQLSGIGCEVGSAILPSIVCTGSRSVSFNQATNLNLYLNLMVKNGGQGNFLVNGAAGVITASQFAAVPGTAGVWYAAHIALSTTNYPQGSVVSITNTSSLFQMGLLTGSVMTGTAFGYFSDFGGLLPYVSTNTPVCSDSTIHLSVDSLGNATYSWIGPNGFTSSLQNPSINNASAADSGLYVLNVTANGCTATDTILVAVIPSKTSTQNVTICSDSAIVFGGQTLDSSGTYVHHFTAANGCDSIATINLTLSYPPDTLTLTMDRLGCIGQQMNMQLNGNTQNLTYLWSFDNGTIASGSGAGPYHISWPGTGTKHIQVTTSNPCGTLSYSDSLSIRPSPVAKITNISKSQICGGDTISLAAYTSQGYTYKWQPQNSFLNTSSPQTTAIILAAGNVTLTVSDSTGCTSSDSTYLSVDPCCHVSLPNAFSPNKDGKNDIYRVITLSHDQLIYFRIANRWGQIVFETKDMSKGWDGTLNGTPQEIGTYYYILRYKCVDNHEIVQKGDLLLLR